MLLNKCKNTALHTCFECCIPAGSSLRLTVYRNNVSDYNLHLPICVRNTIGINRHSNIELISSLIGNNKVTILCINNLSNNTLNVVIVRERHDYHAICCEE